MGGLTCFRRVEHEVTPVVRPLGHHEIDRQLRACCGSVASLAACGPGGGGGDGGGGGGFLLLLLDELRVNFKLLVGVL